MQDRLGTRRQCVEQLPLRKEIVTNTVIATFDPETVPVQVYTRNNLTAQLAQELNDTLVKADTVAVDTETVYDQTMVDVPEHLQTALDRRSTDGKTAAGNLVYGIDRYGNETSWVRRLDVDGPGDWRVMSVAAITDGNYQAWVIDLAGLDRKLVQTIVQNIQPFGWNANFDRAVLARDNVDVAYWWDGMILDTIVRAGAGGSETTRYRGLAKASIAYLGYDMEGKGTTQLSYDADSVLTDEQIRYAAVDAIVTAAIGEKLIEAGKEHGLLPTFEREMGAQPLIDAMIRNGLPIDENGYREDVVEPAKIASAKAAQELAVATTGRTLLKEIGKWAQTSTEATSLVVEEDETATGLAVLENVEAFSAFCVEMQKQKQLAAEQVAQATGGQIIEEDLFSDLAGPVTVAPFNLDDETAIRKWLSVQAPKFAATINATTLHPDLTVEDVENAALSNTEQLKLWSAGKVRLLKAHELDTIVLPRLADSKSPDVTDALRDVATSLLTYRHFTNIVNDYGHLQPPVMLRPDWKVNNPNEVKHVLNTYSQEYVENHFAKVEGSARLLAKSDSVDSDMLKLIDCPISKALLAYRKNEKVVSTYGEKFLDFVHPSTGRIHATYKQALTGTGRLSSDKPNAQNISPNAKPYLRPKGTHKVLVAADLSQAELRFGADASQDENMLRAFASGEDLHERTAALMFSVDMKALAHWGKTGTVESVIAITKDGVTFKEPVDPTIKKMVEDVISSAHVTAETTVESLSSVAAKLYKSLRHKAKRVSFGYAYGLGAYRLAEGLTIDGVPTTMQEASELIARFDAAYPQFAAWMKLRVAYIEKLAKDMLTGEDTTVDLVTSWRLHLTALAVKEARSGLPTKASAEEISFKALPEETLRTRLARTKGVAPEAITEEQMREGREEHAAKVTWVDSYETICVLKTDGTPWKFESRTTGGRVRWFPVTTLDWEWGMVNSIVRSRDPQVVQAATEWAQIRTEKEEAEVEKRRERGEQARSKSPIVLKAKNRNGKMAPLTGKPLEKMFEDRTRRTDLVLHILQALPDKARNLLRAGMQDRIKAAVNQYRNHPIQGGVADAMLVAMTTVQKELRQNYPTAKPIQSVHDSLVIECDVKDANNILHLCKTAMESGLNLFCPTVVTKADVDVQLSLDDRTTVSDEELAKLYNNALVTN